MTERTERCCWLVQVDLPPCKCANAKKRTVGMRRLIASSAMVNLTKSFMRVVPSEKKKVQLIPEAIVCHIDESTLFESTVSARLDSRQ